MKKKFLFISCFLLTLFVSSQTASVEKSTFGIQIGFLGIWVHHEAKLTNQLALRSELGLDTGILDNNTNDVSGLFLVPSITLEPRWYYNLSKRSKKSRRTDGNSGNFISIKTTYHPDWFTISSEENIVFVSDISIVPTWGIRRHIGAHFTYETGIGVGYIHYFKKENVSLNNDSEVAINLHLRLGYRF